jgi:hypothetical protein
MSLARCAAGALYATALAALVLGGCSGQPSASAGSARDATAAREVKAVDALDLKKRYKDVVMGTDVKGSTLVIYVDVNNLYSMDETAEDALRSQTLDQWKRIWAAAHPRKHATLRLSLRDYYGNEVTGDTAAV